jgi:hypothetical protein
MDEVIEDEATHLLEELQRNTQTKYNIHPLLTKASANIINVLTVGERCSYDDPKFTKSVQLVSVVFQANGGGSVGNIRSMFPFLKLLPGDLFGFKKYCSAIAELQVCEQY